MEYDGNLHETRKEYYYNNGILDSHRVYDYANGEKMGGVTFSYEWKKICGYYLEEPMTPFTGMDF